MMAGIIPASKVPRKNRKMTRPWYVDTKPIHMLIMAQLNMRDDK